MVDRSHGAFSMDGVARKAITVAKGLASHAIGRPMVINLNVNVTNLCTQRCPHCNALPEGVAGEGRFLRLRELQEAVLNLPMKTVPTMSLSGGEPTVAPELPDIIEWSGRFCQFGINVNTNLYGPEGRIRRCIEAALRVGARIDVSFDGFGDVADTLRGSRDVAARVEENLRYLASRKKELGSTSVVTLHTVLNDLNLTHVPSIFALSINLGFRQTIAPVNRFTYMQSQTCEAAFSLTDGPKLRHVLELAEKAPNLGQSRRFIRQIPSYLAGRSPRLCPYLSPLFRSYKVFLSPGGEVTLCDRTSPIGNLLETPLQTMMRTARYASELQKYRKCPGCWMICFVEPMLRVKVWTGRGRQSEEQRP